LLSRARETVRAHAGLPQPGIGEPRVQRLLVMTEFVETTPPNPADVLTIARKLHPIGPDLVDWTAGLLR
jgi:hypothetical protein